jgi:hypothetical protein
MESIVMHRILNFIYNNNIDIVEEVFKDKVSDGMLNHLLEKKERFKAERNDNIKAWFDFIGRLDGENSSIM